VLTYFIKKDKLLLFVGIHFLLGIATAIIPQIIIAWFYLVLITEYEILLQKKSNHLYHTALIVYLSGFELIGRMARATPFMPFELSKYFMLSLFIIGIIRYGIKGNAGIIMAALLIPGFIIDHSDSRDWAKTVFNGFGILNIALGVVYFYKRKIEDEGIRILLRMAAYTLITASAYTFYKTPTFDEIEFTYTTASGTTGGFGPNQVSTAFGLGACLVFILWISKIPLSGKLGIDLSILGLFILQAILSFSRGGVIGGLLGIIVMSVFTTLNNENRRKGKNKINVASVWAKLSIGVLIAIIGFIFINNISGEKLLHRYKGETEASIAGQKEITVNTYTSDRYDIFFGDLRLWAEYPIFGTGVGASQTLRDFMIEETAAHVELSRLLAEHGLLGLIFFIILCFVGSRIFIHNPISIYKAIFGTLFLVALYSTFHAALRTYISPLFLTMTLMVVVPTIKKQNTTI